MIGQKGYETSSYETPWENYVFMNEMLCYKKNHQNHPI